MKIGLIAFAAMLAVGAVGVDAAVESLGAEGVFTKSAAAICIHEPVTGTCLPLCPDVDTPPAIDKHLPTIYCPA